MTDLEGMMRQIRAIVTEKPKGPEPWNPTPDEIAEGCKAIQLEWSEAERRRRSGLSKSDGDRWVFPVVRVSEEPE